MKSVTEWLLAFKQYYNNITSNKAPGLNPYEISVFLTDAQESVVLQLVRGNLGDSFESSEQTAVFLAPLVDQETIKYVGGGSSSGSSEPSGSRVVDPKMSYVFPNSTDLLYRTLEFCTITTDDCGDIRAEVIPTTQDEYLRTARDPFKRPNKRKVLRLIAADTAEARSELVIQPYTELISAYPVKDYTVRFIKRPEPIILETLPPGLKIRGKSAAQTCLLDESLHNIILVEAVKMAKAVWISQ